MEIALKNIVLSSTTRRLHLLLESCIRIEKAIVMNVDGVAISQTESSIQRKCKKIDLKNIKARTFCAHGEKKNLMKNEQKLCWK